MEDRNSLGHLLSNARNDKNLSIEQVSQKTKINPKILEALESNNKERLPNITYVRGFVKSFARTVGLNQQEAIVALENLYQIIDSKEETQSPQTTEEKKAEVPFLKEETDNAIEEIRETAISVIHNLMNRNVLIAFVVFTISIFIIRGVVNWFAELNQENGQIAQTKEETKEELKKEDPLPETIKVEEQKKLDNIIAKDIEKVVEKEPVEAPIESAPKIVKEKKKVVEKIIEKEEKTKDGKFPYKDFYPAPLNLFSVVENAPEAQDESLLPIKVRNSLKQGLENVHIVAADGDCWVSYQSDANKIKRFILKKGRRVTIRGEKILLFIGNFTGSRVFYNNKFVKAQTKSGVKSLIFPPSAASSEVLPLFPSYKGIPYKADVYQKNMRPKQEN